MGGCFAQYSQIRDMPFSTLSLYKVLYILKKKKKQKTYRVYKGRMIHLIRNFLTKTYKDTTPIETTDYDYGYMLGC